MSTSDHEEDDDYLQPVYCRPCDREIQPIYDYEYEEWYCPMCASTVPANDVPFYEWMDYPPMYELDGEMLPTQ